MAFFSQEIYVYYRNLENNENLEVKRQAAILSYSLPKCTAWKGGQGVTL